MDLVIEKLTCLTHLTLSYLISGRGKCPISVIFYFVMKVSRGCEKEEMHYKSPPWENRVEEHTRLCRSDSSVSRCFIHSLSAFTSLLFDVDEDGPSARRQSMIFLSAFVFFSPHFHLEVLFTQLF